MPTTVPGALRQPFCTAVGDSKGSDAQDALESRLSHFGVQASGPSDSKDVAAELKQENEAVGSLRDVTDAEESSISTITMDDAEEPVAPVQRARGRRRGSSQKCIQVDRDDDDDAESEEEHEDVPAAFKNKFIKLSHLIPPHPEKGTFEVETIRKSLYFFS